MWTMLNTSLGREENSTADNSNGFVYPLHVIAMIIGPLTVLCSLFGLVGNGKVIWIFTFCSERNPFTTYILNLAIDDFGTLLSLSARVILFLFSRQYYTQLCTLTYFTYSTSVYFLTIISLERCLSVLFPIWYRCHRPQRSSAVVSLLIWIISSLFSGAFLLSPYLGFESYLLSMKAIFTNNLLICTPKMVASTLIMSIKLCRSTQRRQPPRLYTTILVTLLFFIVFAIPLSMFYFISLSTGLFSSAAFEISFLFASFNSSINPIIYYFVGRNRKKCRESLKVVFKRVFMNDAMSPNGT